MFIATTINRRQRITSSAYRKAYPGSGLGDGCSGSPSLALFVKPSLDGLRVHLCDLQIEDPALTQAVDCGEAERAECSFDRLVTAGRWDYFYYFYLMIAVMNKNRAWSC